MTRPLTADQIAEVLLDNQQYNVVTSGVRHTANRSPDFGRWLDMALEAGRHAVEDGSHLDYDLAITPTTVPARMQTAIEKGLNAARFKPAKTKITALNTGTTIRRVTE